MNEKNKTWLVNMVDEEIETTKSDIANQRIWANGAPDDDTTEMHCSNIDELEEYIEVLEGLKEKISLDNI